jgi:hypothetical protein
MASMPARGSALQDDTTRDCVVHAGAHRAGRGEERHGLRRRGRPHRAFAKKGVRGRILYISHNLIGDPAEGPAFLAGALRFMAAEAKRG